MFKNVSQKIELCIIKWYKFGNVAVQLAGSVADMLAAITVATTPKSTTVYIALYIVQ